MAKPTSPMKRTGWAQPIYAQAATKKERIGVIRWTYDGRAYRYSKAGEGLNPGKMSVAAQCDAAHIDEAIRAAVPVGTTQLTLTVTAGTAIAQGALEGGYFEINSGTGAGYRYAIAGNSAIDASGTTIYLDLDESIRVALDTTSTFNLIHSLWYSTTETSTDENFATGVTPITVTSGYYYWSQTHGPCTALIKDTPAIGSTLILGSTEGAVAVIATSVDVDVPIVGTITHLVGVSADYSSIFLQID